MREKEGRPIIIGRYQPFHGGHEVVVRDIVAREGPVIIGIGRPRQELDVRPTQKYPFSFEETEEMVRRALRDIEDKIDVVRIDDLHNDEEWREQVKAVGSRAGGIRGFVTNNRWVRRCLGEAMPEIKALPLHERNTFEGTRIRWKIRTGKRNWEGTVHPSVAEYLKRIGTQQRLMSVYHRHRNNK